MKGRKTNQIFGLVNILTALVVCFYIYLFKENSFQLTRHQKQVFETVKIGINIVLAIVVILNVVYGILNKKKKTLLGYYLISVFSLMLYYSYDYVYTIFLFVSGILVIPYMKKNNYIERESTIGITISSILIITIIGIATTLGFYTKVGDYIKKKENVNLIKYDEEYFKYISPVEIEEKYINVKENGKWGYVNKEGDEVINFIYDFATPFYKIKAFDKEFEVAGVSKGKVTTIILKNQREVMSYNSEYENNDMLGKIEEFENELKTTLKQEEINKKDSSETQNLIKKKVYDEDTTNKDYTYRFDYSTRFDVIVTESQMGNKPIFKFANKNNIKDTIEINAENILYDKTGLYVFKNGYLPFYSKSENIQGWFDLRGNRKKIEGNYQIIDLDSEKILIKNNKKKLVYFIDYDMKEISKMYKEVIPFDDKYIVRNSEENTKWTIIDNNLEKYVNEEWDIFTNRFLDEELYAFANLRNDELEVNDENYIKLEYALFKKDFTLFRNMTYEEIYDIFYRIKDIEDEEEKEKYLETIKSGEIQYPGEKYYKGLSKE